VQATRSARSAGSLWVSWRARRVGALKKAAGREGCGLDDCRFLLTTGRVYPRAMQKRASTGVKSLQEVARLFRPIREEVTSLLASRHVFRAVQEIVRQNTRLERPFNAWIQVVYASASAAAVRRLAAPRYRPGDASFIVFFDEILRDRGSLFDVFPRCLPERAEAILAGHSADGRRALRRLIGTDKAQLIREATKVVDFASKRIAHHNLTTVPRMKLLELDRAIDLLKALAEKYTLMVYGKRSDLLEEARTRRLPDGWNAIFLEPWATRETLALNLGEMDPPKR